MPYYLVLESMARRRTARYSFKVSLQVRPSSNVRFQAFNFYWIKSGDPVGLILPWCDKYFKGRRPQACTSRGVDINSSIEQHLQYLLTVVAVEVLHVVSTTTVEAKLDSACLHTINAGSSNIDINA